MSPFIASAFLMGLLGGAHCVAMCGGVVGVLCSVAPRLASASAPASPAHPSRALYWVAYNGGRIASYTLLGALFGALGALGASLFPLDVARLALRAIAALCMLAVGLHLAGLPSVVRGLESLGAPLWRRISKFTRRFIPLRTPWQALVLGALWGLMPCGLLYGALALASSAESPAAGAGTMAAFGLGTLPVMLTMSAVAQGVARWLARAWVRRLAGAVVLAFGLWSTTGVIAQVSLGDRMGPGAPFGAESPPCCPTR